MRIVGGTLRGRTLKTIPTTKTAAEIQLRPTGDRAREALFNRLAHGNWPFPPRRALDLFAGTGALGLEALSRGAEYAVFIETHPMPRAMIRENIENLGLIGQSKLYRRDAMRLGACRSEPFDLIFLDPPYGKNFAEPALKSAYEGGWIAPNAIIILETGTEDTRPNLPWLPEGDVRIVGAAKIELISLHL